MKNSVVGVDSILKKLEAKLGANQTTRIVNKALRTAGKESNDIVKAAVSGYKDTGATYDLVVTSNVKSNPKRIEIGWASKQRSPIVHLNEFGYTRYGRYVRPRGMGKLQEAVDKIGRQSVITMRKELEELVK